MKLKLHWQVAIAMLVGTALGFLFRGLEGTNPDSIFYNAIVGMGTVFMRLLRMVIVPLIFTSIVSGVSGIGKGQSLGRLGFKTLLYYLVTSLAAILTGLSLTNFMEPGVGADLPAANSFNPDSISTPASAADILIRMIPLNPFSAAVNGDMLGIIFFSIFLGIVMSHISSESSLKLKSFFDASFEAMMKMTDYIIRIVPFGVLGLMVKSVAGTGFGMFAAVGKYVLTIFIALSFHFLVVLPLIFYITTRMNPLKHFKAMAPALLTAFSTSSSNATLPLTIKNVEENAGVSNKISGFVLPLGATINMDGTALYECAGVIFISQVLGLELTLIQQFIIVITALLASIGCAGIPSAGLVVIFIVTQAVGFTDSDVAVIIGTMLAVDRPLDMYRTMINVMSDSIGTVVVAKSEGEDKLYQKI